MAEKRTARPTEAELAILRVLWDRGPSTVREIQDVLERHRGTGYTTTLKLLQIMHDKRLVRRDESQRSHVYEAAITRQKTQRRLVGELLDQLFSGSASQLVLQALSARKSSPDELREIRRIVEELERDQS